MSRLFPGEGRGPAARKKDWIPAFAGKRIRFKRPALTFH
jgi:hypothetical protein